METLDWILVVALNGAVIGYGFLRARGVLSSREWFLAGRGLPWWLVGLSMYATAIDASDLVADSGGTYVLGFRYFITGWVGTVAGWFAAAHWIFPAMYRRGMYTNAEYLEARFGAGARVLSVVVQVQYRTLVLGIIGMALHLTLVHAGGLGSGAAWGVVVGFAALAALYTMSGGLRAVAVTDALQFVIMCAAALAFWFVVWGEVGGWPGVEERLGATGTELASDLLHAGSDATTIEDVSDRPPAETEGLLRLGGEHDPELGIIRRVTPAWVVALAFVILGFAYSIVNHTQAMRMFGAKSVWDMKMAAVVAGLAMLIFSFLNLSMGVFGRALYPDPSVLPGGRTDSIYPVLLDRLAAPGLKGLIVAGIFAAAISTYDSVGSTLSALLTRDVYARLLVRGAPDRHYLRAGRIFTPVVIAVSFLYSGFLEEGMLLFYVDVTSALVVPLLTLYLMGTFTRVHRRSGIWGLAAGGIYGAVRLAAPAVASSYGVAILPAALVDPYAAYLWSMLITAVTMVVVSAAIGWEGERNALRAVPGGEPAAVLGEPSGRRDTLAFLLGLIAVAAGAYLSFAVWW